MLECASICPETTQEKLESQRVYLTPLTTFFVNLLSDFTRYDTIT